MTFFASELSYQRQLTRTEYRSISKVVNQEHKFLTIAGWLFRILVPIAAVSLTGFNFIVLALSFIIVDAIVWAINWKMSVADPHCNALNLPLVEYKKRLRELVAKRDSLREQVTHQEMDGVNHSAINNEIADLTTYIDLESDWVDNVLTPFKEREESETANNGGDINA